MLLGFEQPETGAVEYDGKDLGHLDVRAVRQQMGVVVQNARLLPGSIFQNIIGSSALLDLDDAWEAARIAGIGGRHRADADGDADVHHGGRRGLLGRSAAAAS